MSPVAKAVSKLPELKVAPSSDVEVTVFLRIKVTDSNVTKAKVRLENC